MSSRAVDERRRVTVLFADLVDSTPLAERFDAEDVKDAIEYCLRRLGRDVEDCGGEVLRYLGDGLMALFGAPVGHEDDPERAVRAGLAMQAAMAEAGALPLAGSRVSLRVGINSGSVMAGPFADHYDVIGDAVNVAARLEATAPAGGVLVGEETFRATQHAIEYRSLGAVRLKGKANPVPVWEAVAPLPRRAALQTRKSSEAPLIGRDPELTLLTDMLDCVVRDRRSQYLTLSGDPGVGKSRLVREFARRVAERWPGATVRSGRCLPYGRGVTFWALGEIVKEQCGIRESDSPEAAGERLSASLTSLVPDRRERDWIRARVSTLVGAGEAASVVDSDQVEVFAAWRRFVEVVATAQPLVLVVEDLHWADAGMLAFLAYLAESASDVPLLGVATCRPDEGSSRGWDRGPSPARVTVAPLEVDDTERLIDDLLAAQWVRPGLRAALSARAGGNPLFAEELVRMVLERQSQADALAEIDDRPMLVPDTVQAVMSARLDALSETERVVLHDAAVIGERFWLGALAEIAGADRQAVRPILECLANHGFIRAQPRSVVRDEEEYAFWHVLMRDVAYQRLRRTARAAKHRAAARWIQEMAGDRSNDHAEMLASHYSAALSLSRSIPGVSAEELRDDAAHALTYAVHAGGRAMRLHAHDEAARHYAEALRALDLVDPADARRRCELLVARGDAERRAGAVDDAKRTLEDAAELAMEIGASLLLAGAALAYAGPSVQMGRLDARVITLLEAAQSRLASDAPALRARVLARLAMELYFGGAAERRAALLDDAVFDARRAGDPAALAFVLGASHWTRWEPENSEQRLAVATELLQLAERLDERELALQGHHWRLTDLLELGHIPAADRELEAHAQLAYELRQPYYVWQTQLRRALRAQMSGDLVEAERLSREAWAMGKEIDRDTAAGYLLAMRMVLARDRGGLAELLPELSHYVERFPAQPAWRAMRAWIHEGCGELHAAARDLEMVMRDDLAGLPRDYRWTAAVAMSAEVAVTLADRERAAVLYEALRPLGTRNVILGRTAVVLGSAGRYLGLLATLLGRWEEAEAHLDRSLAISTAMNAWPAAAHTHLALARLALARHGPDGRIAADRYTAAALEIARRLALDRVTDSAQELRAGLVQDAKSNS